MIIIVIAFLGILGVPVLWHYGNWQRGVFGIVQIIGMLIGTIGYYVTMARPNDVFNEIMMTYSIGLIVVIGTWFTGLSLWTIFKKTEKCQ